MKTMARLRMFAVAVFVAAITVPVLGQNAPDNPPPAAGGGGGGGGDQRGQGGGRNRQGWDPAQMRQQMIDRMKEALGASDEELAVLQPKIEHLMQLQRDAMGGGRGGMMMFRGNRGGGPGGPGGDRAGRGGDRGGPPSADRPVSPVQEKMHELQTLLDNKDASPDAIKTKLAEVREVRAKAKEELTKAQQDLREVLTQRQEAVLVTMGMLD